MRTFFGLVSACLLVACSGKDLAVGSQETGDSGTESGTEAAASPPSTAFAAAVVQAANAACSAPHGPTDAYSTVDGLTSRAVGAWYLCAGAQQPTFTSDSSAVFTADGQWHRLVSDGSGGLVESQGVQDSGRYSAAPTDDASAECDPSNCLITYQGDDGQITQFNLAFETGPRRMLLGSQLWFVPLGQ